MSSVLRSLRVIELAGLAPSPYCGMVLADFGANVIRIDRVGGGGYEQLDNGLSRGKRSLALDLKLPKARAVFLKLVDQADVLLEPFRPGVMEKLGFSPETLLSRNPRLIYTRLTGWGQNGEYAQKAGHDINYIGLSGLLNCFGRKEENPYPPVNIVGDFAGGGMLAVVGILLALVERSSSGRGQVVDAAMVDGSCYLSQFLVKGMENGLHSGPRGTNLLDTGAPFYETYKTADNKFMAVGSIEAKFYEGLLTGLDLSSEEKQQFLEKQMDQSFWPEMKTRFTTLFSKKTQAEWTKIFDQIDACVTPVLSFQEAAQHPHNFNRKLFTDVENNNKTEIQASPAPRLSRTPGVVQQKQSKVNAGKHSVEILREFGFQKEDIDSLLKEGVVVQEPQSAL